jgi:hypothetical protein
LESYFKYSHASDPYYNNLTNLLRLSESYILDYPLYCYLFKRDNEAQAAVQHYSTIHQQLIEEFTEKLPESIPPEDEETKQCLWETMDALSRDIDNPQLKTNIERLCIGLISCTAIAILSIVRTSLFVVISLTVFINRDVGPHNSEFRFTGQSQF